MSWMFFVCWVILFRMEDAFAEGNWTRYFVRYNKHAAFEWPQPLNTFLGVCLIFSLHVYPWYAYRSHPILYLCCIGCTASLPLLLPHTFCTSHSHCRFCTWKTPVILTPWEILNAFPCFSCTKWSIWWSIWTADVFGGEPLGIQECRRSIDRSEAPPWPIGSRTFDSGTRLCLLNGARAVFCSANFKQSKSVWKETYTPPKLNMEPENKSLEKESPFGKHYFQVPC